LAGSNCQFWFPLLGIELKTGLNFGTKSELSFKPDPVLELEHEAKSRIGTGIFEKNVFGGKWFKTVA
jgi:hypothetical protein